MLDRRRFLQLSSGATLASAGAPMWTGRAAAQDMSLAERALAAGQDRVALGASSGAYMDVILGHFINPFTEATGIRVDRIAGSLADRYARLRAMDEVGNVEWDVVALLDSDTQNPEITQFLEDLGDCSALPNVAANGLAGACLRYGVLFDIGGTVLAYDQRAFPDGGPQNWGDFWDVERFPGPRALHNYGNPWETLVIALLADGVAPDALFPLDQDRAYRQLEALRPHVTVWWNSGDQSQQIFRAQEVVMAPMWSNRAGQIHSDGLVDFTWDGAIQNAGAYCVVRNAPRPLAAMALLDYFYSRPEAAAAFMMQQHAGMAVRRAAELTEPAFRETLVTNPDNWSRVVRLDHVWVADNRDAILERWNGWISG